MSIIKNVFTLIDSPVTPIDQGIVLEGIDATKPHCFAGIQFFADSQGQTQALPTVGTILIDIRTHNTFPVFEAIQNGLMDLAKARQTISWTANTVTVRATPTAINAATHYKLIVTCNERGSVPINEVEPNVDTSFSSRNRVETAVTDAEALRVLEDILVQTKLHNVYLAEIVGEAIHPGELEE